MFEYADMRPGNLALKTFWLQARALMWANLKTRYRDTISGFLWVFLFPVLQYGTQAFVFYKILRIDVDSYPLFLLSGLLPWIFIVQTVDMGTSMLAAQGGLLKSFPIHPSTLIASLAADNLFNYFTAFLILLIPVGLYSKMHFINLIMLPLPMISLLIGVSAATYTLSVINVFYYDTKYIVSFALGILFFLTPIIYPMHFVPEEIRWFYHFNPAAHWIGPFREMIKNPFTLEFALMELKSLTTSALCLLIAGLVWHRRRGEFYLRL